MAAWCRQQHGAGSSMAWATAWRGQHHGAGSTTVRAGAWWGCAGLSASGLALIKASLVQFHVKGSFIPPSRSPSPAGARAWARRLPLVLPAWLGPNEVCVALGCRFSISFLLLQSCCSEVQTSLITWQNLSAGIQKGRRFY